MHLSTSLILSFLAIPAVILSVSANLASSRLAANEDKPNLVVTQANRSTMAGQPLRVGQYVKVGEEVHAKSATVTRKGYVLGGNAQMTMFNWGVNQITLTPNSSATLVSYGKCFGGGRVSQFEVAGKVYITTRKKTHRCSNTIVCMVSSQGCVALNSEVVFKKLGDGKYAVAVKEGKVLGRKRLSTATEATINANEYSVVAPSGAFSPPKKVTNKPLLRVITQTPAVKVVEVEEGYLLKVGKRVARRLQFAVGITPKIISPLD
jgi:uncharacterized protein (DUF1499 family)